MTDKSDYEPSSLLQSLSRHQGPLIRLLIAALLWGWFVAFYLSDAVHRDPRSLVFLLPLTPPLVYTALSAMRQLKGASMTGSWRTLFIILAIMAAIPGGRLVEKLARVRERSVLESLWQPVLSEVRTRQASSGRPPAEMEEVLRLRLPELPPEDYRQRHVTYGFNESLWAIQIDCVAGDRDDDATLTLASDGRSFRHDSGSDGGRKGSRKLLEAELPFLATARSCSCEKPFNGADTRWRCAPPCGTWASDPTPTPIASPSPSPSTETPLTGATPRAVPPPRR